MQENKKTQSQLKKGKDADNIEQNKNGDVESLVNHPHNSNATSDQNYFQITIVLLRSPVMIWILTNVIFSQHWLKKYLYWRTRKVFFRILNHSMSDEIVNPARI